MLVTQDLRDFSITSWYESFKDVTLQTVIIALPLDLVVKLRSDATDLEVRESCPEEVIDQIKHAIASFQDATAFVKNNWHAPVDAKFISFGNSLKATCVGDVFLYLTASDVISTDFANDKYDTFCIALRPWINIHPASEFRCIVVNNVLQGITPRDWPTFYAHFNNDGPEIITVISNFFEKHLKRKFCRQTFVFDVVLNYPNEVTLLDFGALNNKTNLYAFTWNEIHGIIQKNSEEEVAPVFRYLENDMGIMTKSEALFNVSQANRNCH